MTIYALVVLFAMLTAFVVLVVVFKRRIEREEMILSLCLEMLGVIREGKEVLGRVRKADLESREKLVQLRSKLEALLSRIDKVEELYGISLAKQDTNPNLLVNMMKVRSQITSCLDLVRIIVMGLESTAEK